MSSSIAKEKHFCITTEKKCNFKETALKTMGLLVNINVHLIFCSYNFKEKYFLGSHAIVGANIIKH